MNEIYELNSELIRNWLDKERRKLSYITQELRVSGTTLHRMLNQKQVPKDRTLIALAHLMGVEVSTLLLPKKAKAG